MKHCRICLARKQSSAIKQLCQNIDPNGYWKPYNSRLNNLYCTQVQSTKVQSRTKPSKCTINSIANQISNILNGMYVIQQTIHR